MRKSLKVQILAMAALAAVAVGCGSGEGKTFEPKPKGTVDANGVEVQQSGTVIVRDPGGDK